MDITVRTSDGTPLSGETTHQLDTVDVLVIMVRKDEGGSIVVEGFEPAEIDRHPDTLGRIGSRIVSFAEGS